ncbi:hypothetical protein C0Q70_18605 [Pomacea canaliculata]|uniref:Polymerase nucleotidyl transferase domain-containing protein n=1 Tax=Pomacea canaliculata TaxID=400727 RepID=A0A2T7NGZ8_POMCA|nr:hypothetical protein C0Q70_18605 [Pomacea canaliculata]
MDEIFPDMRPGQSLDDYIEKSLRPTPQEFSRFHTAVDLFVRFLQKTFSDSTYSVAKVLKSGSLAKGTALRDSSDIDLVVFINGLTDIDDLMVAREALKRRMIAAAETYPSSLKTKKSTKFAAKFAFNNIELDVLPAFDALRSCGVHQDSQVLSKGLHSSHETVEKGERSHHPVLLSGAVDGESMEGHGWIQKATETCIHFQIFLKESLTNWLTSTTFELPLEEL